MVVLPLAFVVDGSVGVLDGTEQFASDGVVCRGCLRCRQLCRINTCGRFVARLEPVGCVECDRSRTTGVETVLFGSDGDERVITQFCLCGRVVAILRCTLAAPDQTDRGHDPDPERALGVS